MKRFILAVAAALFAAFPLAPHESSAQVVTPPPAAEEQPIGGQGAAAPVYYFYLVPWHWEAFDTAAAPGQSDVLTPFPHWRIKYTDALALIDLRSNTQAGCNGAVLRCVDSGYALGIYTAPLSAGITDAVFLATWQGSSGTIQPVNRQDAAFLLYRLPDFEASTVDGLVREIFTVYSDPAGITAVKPLRPTPRRVIYADIGPVRLFTDRLATDSAGWLKTRESFALDYEAIRTASGDTTALKVAGMWLREYGVDMRTPEQIQRDGPVIKPETTITETWTCANSDTFSCDLTWTEVVADWDIVSNQGTKTVNATGAARAESDLSSSDMYAQVECSSIADFNWCGVAARYSSSADTTYYYRWDNDSVSNNLYKRVAGTDTVLTTGTNDYCAGACGTITIKLEVNGSALSTWYNGAARISTTDTSITSGTRCGLWGFHAAPNYDNFTCADLAAAAARRVFVDVE